MRDYSVSLKIGLSPVYHSKAPAVNLSVPGHQTCTDLTCSRIFEFDFTAHDVGWIEIEFYNKTNQDSCLTQGLDLAVKIDFVEFFGIRDPKFVWLGEYQPSYPEPWFSQQTPPPPSVLTNVDYLGWNGKWRLNFDVPVFTWIHRVQNHGWLYT